MKRTAIFYGPVGGKTEKIAERLREMIGRDRCDLIKVRDSDRKTIGKYDNIIFGTSTIGMETWDGEQVRSGWFTFIHELAEAELKGRKIALFGLGDHIRYAGHFVDAIGEIYEILQKKGVDTIGKVDPAEYQFSDSKALAGGMFVGLPIDEEFEADKSEERMRKWVDTLLREFAV
jgi:flavodoxin I